MMLQPCVLAISLMVIAHPCSCVHRANYNRHILDEEKFCHGLNRKSYTHDIQNGTAVIITSHRIFDRLVDVRSTRTCLFKLKPAKNEGILAVINKMYFRSHGNSCLDYVQFKRNDGQSTGQFCGEVDRIKSIYRPFRRYNDSKNDYDMFAEYDAAELQKSIELQTTIVIAKEKVSSGQSLNLSIIYTPFRNCLNVDRNWKHVGNNICIRKEYVCDRIYNCPTSVCFDEKNCTYVITDQYPKDDTATKVTVGAVTTMILCFIIFVMCLWICKKSQKLCWSSDCAGPNVCSRPGSSQDIEGGVGSNRAVPTAPMLEVAVTSPVADKDLPPSYDSLFPEQSNPARS